MLQEDQQWKLLILTVIAQHTDKLPLLHVITECVSQPGCAVPHVADHVLWTIGI